MDVESVDVWLMRLSRKDASMQIFKIQYEYKKLPKQWTPEQEREQSGMAAMLGMGGERDAVGLVIASSFESALEIARSNMPKNAMRITACVVVDGSTHLCGVEGLDIHAEK